MSHYFYISLKSCNKDWTYTSYFNYLVPAPEVKANGDRLAPVPPAKIPALLRRDEAEPRPLPVRPTRPVLNGVYLPLELLLRGVYILKCLV